MIVTSFGSYYYFNHLMGHWTYCLHRVIAFYEWTTNEIIKQIKTYIHINIPNEIRVIIRYTLTLKRIIISEKKVII